MITKNSALSALVKIAADSIVMPLRIVTNQSEGWFPLGVNCRRGIFFVSLFGFMPLDISGHKTK